MLRSHTFRMFLLALLVPLSLAFQIEPVSLVGQAQAQDAKPAEKDAFEAAKDLGTKDAWAAFLTSFPTGFYADLARAHLKKLDESGEAPAAGPAPTLAPPPSSARVAERSCSERNTLRSEHSREPTKITFVNNSGMYRGLMWINFDGQLQDYGGVNSGDQVTLDTFRTHPWMIVTGPGDCLQIFLPAAEPATAELRRLPADDPPAKAPAKAETKPAETKPSQVKCAKNYKLVQGKCVLIQNCGQNAYRSPEGDCYCKKGYKMRNGKCVWPQDSKGFEVAPWKKTGCKGLQSQCAQGNSKACASYEATCQVN